ncbi:methyltransferase domain-containing protein [Sphingomonas sp. LHG3443-2]|uniref:methyltransferase domain-containing protein n=1 Tax=Sphingomonas sp. LHG3443-2 TaxID=2804639 RepID=UPI003CF672F6
MIELVSPLSGKPLHRDSAHSLSDGTSERWPVIDDIPYLRVGSEELAARLLAHLDRGESSAALVLLLAENDRWWNEPPPPPAQLRDLVDRRGTLTLREAMALLGWGRVGDYFAHRWSDPTYVAGLALLDAHWTAPATAFELACGIGHYLRALCQVGVRAIGADLVFAKLWVARHWVAPEAELVCFDAEQPWPVRLRTDLALCHDAFYFLGNKPHVAAQLLEAAATVALAHVHNSQHPNLSTGEGMTRLEVEDLFPDATLYADEELTACGASGRLPEPFHGDKTEAFGIAIGPPASEPGPLGMPLSGASLTRNPLCIGGAPAWPSERYADEYGGRVTYACRADLPDRTLMAPEWIDAVRRRELVDLPERW